MGSLAPLAGVLASAVVTLLVYADASRRDRPQRRRFPWAIGVGTASFGGFLLPALFGDALRRAYLHRVKPEPVVTSPLEILVLDLSVGVPFSVAAVFAYVVATLLDGR